MNRYNPKDIEPRWQAKWTEDKVYEAIEDAEKAKIYATPMLPYPSGTGLHTGHVRNYSITDAVARFYRQKGFNTVSTMGWDAFGLPAENFAIKTGTPPAESTAKNVAYFKKQLLRLGMSYDWSREVNTSDPEYYKWTQWVFSLMYERGLAYKDEKSQWWCEKCNTVLADEQVTAAGKCWRHEGADDPEVTKKKVNQWFFKITDYADEILDATDDLNWPEKIKTMQKNWIGRSQGAEVSFKVDGSDQVLKVFTTRPDTLFGVTFMVVAPEHELLQSAVPTEQKQAVDEYVKSALKKSEVERQENKEKTGVFSGIYAINPVNNEKVPVWVADYVLASYGTGAIMAVPAHDERDYAFAKKFDLPIKQVVMPNAADTNNPPKPGMKMVERPTVIVHLLDKSTGKFALLDWHESLEGITTGIMGGVEDGQTPEEAALMEIREEAALEHVKIIDKLEWLTAAEYCASHKGENRRAITTVLLAEVENLDKQGEIAANEQKNHTLVWVEKDKVLDRITPDHQKQVWNMLWNRSYLPGEGQLINSGNYDRMSAAEARDKIVADLAKQGVAEEKTTYRMRDWLISRQRYWGAPVPIVYCDEHGPVLVPEDQLPVVLPEVKNYVPDGKNSSVLAGVEDWVNTSCPTCGKPAKRETDTMDGYVCSTWYLHRYTDAHNDKQAFDPKKANYWFPIDFYFGADHAVAHLLYIRFFQKVLCDAGLAAEREPIKRLIYNGYINAEDGRKMSKSLGNTVDPMDIIESGYGADALRLFELFIAPYDQDTSWSSTGVPGTYRFLNRYWTLVQEYLEQTTPQANDAVAEQLTKLAHKTAYKVTKDMDELGFNTAVAAMMAAVNELFLIKAKHGYGEREAWDLVLSTLAQLLGPFAPHIAEEVWHDLGRTDTVHQGHWPAYDETYLQEATLTIAIQINGKLRDTIEVAAGTDQATVISSAKAAKKIEPLVKGKEIVKEIYVPGRLVNLVIK
ncbi:MAG: class I tRNA ligase family protein [Candidatus Saccharibacteria bacterium]|nr:class I tRNA ligase family protein [Candidatus Saccharibacteria bacterium]